MIPTAQGQAIDPLTDDLIDGMFDPVQIAMIHKAGGELPDHPVSFF